MRSIYLELGFLLTEAELTNLPNLCQNEKFLRCIKI